MLIIDETFTRLDNSAGELVFIVSELLIFYARELESCLNIASLVPQAERNG